eukprot:scaffold1221_cov207-Amphora_coffeaeformis.AAC.20
MTIRLMERCGNRAPYLDQPMEEWSHFSSYNITFVSTNKDNPEEAQQQQQQLPDQRPLPEDANESSPSSSSSCCEKFITAGFTLLVFVFRVVVFSCCSNEDNVDDEWMMDQ